MASPFRHPVRCSPLGIGLLSNTIVLGMEQETMEPNATTLFSDNRNVLIIILSTLLILSVLGVAFMNTIFDGLRRFLNLTVGFFSAVIGNAMYSTGDIINATSNGVSEVAKTSISLGNGAVNDTGDLLKTGATGTKPQPVTIPTPIPILIKVTEGPTTSPTLSDSPPTPSLPPEPEPTPSDNPIHQAPKTAWCYVGKVNGARNCIQVNPDKQACQSGRLFSSANICVDP